MGYRKHYTVVNSPILGQVQFTMLQYKAVVTNSLDWTVQRGVMQRRRSLPTVPKHSHQQPMNIQHLITLHCHTPATPPTTHLSHLLLHILPPIYRPLPLQMMIALQETGGGVSLSKLVIGDTTSRCPLQTMTAVEKTGGDVSFSELVTGVSTSQCCWWVSPHTST